MAREKRITKSFTTPRGVAVWPKVNEPSYKFEELGEYECTLRFPSSDPAFQKFREEFQAFEQEAYDSMQREHGTAKKHLKHAESPLKQVLDEEGNPTGEWKIKAKMDAAVKPKNRAGWSQRPAVFDAKLVPINTKEVLVGGGSVCRMNFEAQAFYTGGLGAGVSCRLKTVQVLELKSFKKVDPREQGFEEEDGYTPEAAVVANQVEEEEGY